MKHQYIFSALAQYLLLKMIFKSFIPLHLLLHWNRCPLLGPCYRAYIFCFDHVILRVLQYYLHIRYLFFGILFFYTVIGILISLYTSPSNVVGRNISQTDLQLSWTKYTITRSSGMVIVLRISLNASRLCFSPTMSNSKNRTTVRSKSNRLECNQH